MVSIHFWCLRFSDVDDLGALRAPATYCSTADKQADDVKKPGYVENAGREHQVYRGVVEVERHGRGKAIWLGAFDQLARLKLDIMVQIAWRVELDNDRAQGKMQNVCKHRALYANHHIYLGEIFRLCEAVANILSHNELDVTVSPGTLGNQCIIVGDLTIGMLTVNKHDFGPPLPPPHGRLLGIRNI